MFECFLVFVALCPLSATVSLLRSAAREVTVSESDAPIRQAPACAGTSTTASWSGSSVTVTVAVTVTVGSWWGFTTPTTGSVSLTSFFVDTNSGLLTLHPQLANGVD